MTSHQNGNAANNNFIETKFPSISKWVADARERATNLAEKEASTPCQMFLPGMEEFLRAMPNQIARSSLFAPIAKGRRKFHQETPLITRADVVMSYTGEQLDEADADIALQLFFEAKNNALGQPILINRAAFLRAIGRNTGKSSYEWLHRRMKALTVATLFIEAKKNDGSTKFRIGHTAAFHILQQFYYDENNEMYAFVLDPRWQSLFSNREFALIDWEKRLQIGRGHDMAKALQRLIATSANAEQQYALDWLKAKFEYSSPLRKFKEALTNAMGELERMKIIANGCIKTSSKNNEQAVWTKL